MTKKKISLAPEDLVLRLNKKATILDLSKYEDFLFELCGKWEFQKEAIRNTVRFYLSEYSNTKQLLEENYEHNAKMQSLAKKEKFVEQLPFPYTKSATIDLATGTGKSWVMYAVARILLAEGVVDQVLVLCPSKTIKAELYKKFTIFTANNIYNDALPQDSEILVPGIKHSDETIEKGDICIDNVHKTYDHVSSSISDSLENKGERTLVISDEAHHLLNAKPGDKSAEGEWMRFLNDEKYGFKFLLNLTGTPYKGNAYFNDVLYRYSIRQAITNRFVKEIRYLTKDTSETDNERWTAILHNHEKSKKEYPAVSKHITIIVTHSITHCNKLVEELRDFLEQTTKESSEEIEKKVMAVTSSSKHESNREALKFVDEKHSPVEWIVSVSMLTEGWDVSNIFQIVPHEQRAFNSKLLISQVLGRGLRIPKEYRNTNIHPEVKVYNHASWSTNIDRLVSEVAEINNYLTSHIVENSPFNFDLHWISQKKEIKNKTSTPQKQEKIKLPDKLGFHTTPKYSRQEYVNTAKRKSAEETRIEKRTFTIEEAVREIMTSLYIFDVHKKTKVFEKVDESYVQKLIEQELRKIGEKNVSEQNLQRAKASFNVLFRSAVGQTNIEKTYDDVKKINTKEMRPSLLSESEFKNNGALITCPEYFKELSEEDKKLVENLKQQLKELAQTTLISSDPSSFVQGKITDELPLEAYKSPLDVTFVSHNPEREFVAMLVHYTDFIDSWVKSKDKGFYSIPYIHRPGTHSLQKEFNPDFFIKKGNKIIVVEIKADEDSTVKNYDKNVGANTYFEELNKKLKGKNTYEFHFLTPVDYTSFLRTVIKEGKPFRSKLQADLESKSREDLKKGL